MDNPGTLILYHGTDWESALDILNHGLSAANLQRFQGERPTQLGSGWYLTTDITIAWFFASIAPGAVNKQYTVIEMELYWEHFESLIEQGLVRKEPIRNVLFPGEQYLFHLDAFEFLNQQAIFRPYTGDS